MGLGEIGDIVSCNRDGAFCKGYDPRIALTRTQTIVSSASHCDFRYRSGPSAAGLTARESGLPELEERADFQPSRRSSGEMSGETQRGTTIAPCLARSPPPPTEEQPALRRQIIRLRPTKCGLQP
jgi:hypothetical protein